MKSFSLVLVITMLFVSGCAYQAQLMARNGGTIYRGEAQSNGMGSGTLSFQLPNKTCAGPWAKAASGDSFGFFQTYGSQHSSNGFFQEYGGSATYKALLTCTDGTGLRCDVEGADTGAGICVDSKGKIFDMIYTLK